MEPSPPMIRQLAPLACLLSASTTAAAQTPARPCISPAENEALVAYVMPELVGALEQRCAGALPAQPFLGTRSASLKTRLAPQAQRAWPRARKVAQRLAGSRLPVDGPFEGVAKAALAPAAATMIARGFDGERCRIADRLLAELAPLPPENLARVMALFLEVGSAERDEVPFRVCPAN
jgi:hypothetical protein